MEKSNNLNQKFALLKKVLKSYGNMILALSGGKDSILLLCAETEVLGRGTVLAVTASHLFAEVKK